jgi:hypothetical protein
VNDPSFPLTVTGFVCPKYFTAKRPRSIGDISVGEDIFYERGRIRILNNDVFTTKTIESGSIDLVITSPPYNVDIQYNSQNDRGS